MGEYVSVEELRNHAICLYSYGGARYVPLNAIEKMTTASIKEQTCDGCRWSNRTRPQKCSCCSRNAYMKDNYEREEE